MRYSTLTDIAGLHYAMSSANISVDVINSVVKHIGKQEAQKCSE
jgi:hypothetical protein